MAQPIAGQPAPSPNDIRLLGVRVDRITPQRVFAQVLRAVRSTRYLTIFYVNVHCINVARSDASHLARLNAADIVYCDGTGVVLGAALAGLPRPTRMTGADWIWDLADFAQRHGLSLFLLGGVHGSAVEAAAVLQVRYPRLRIAGTLAGYNLGPESVAAVNAARPDILLVGMGTPRQERWVEEHRGELKVPVVWAVGALFDFVSGRIPRGPRWMTDHGLEWACRLAAEPRKLWRRYLLGNPAFLAAIVRQYWPERLVSFLHRLRQNSGHLWARKLRGR